MKNITKRFKNFLSTKLTFLMVYYFDRKVKTDSKTVRRSMYNYFNYHDWYRQDTITKIETYETKKGLEILIVTHRPGILIGKGGKFINGLKDWLKYDLKRDDITINLRECQMWHKLYNF